MSESRDNEKTYNFIAEQLRFLWMLSYCYRYKTDMTTLLMTFQIYHIDPFVLPAAETVVLFEKHQTLTRHIIKSLCQWIYKLYGIFSSIHYTGEFIVQKRREIDRTS